MTNKNRTALYIGVTNDLCRRIYEHKNHLVKGSFTDRYNLEYCIYFEEFSSFNLAIQREKELKKWNRQKKENLINKKNPEWEVLVNENGFVRKNTVFSEQVKDLMNELGIPPVARNDDSTKECEIPPFSRNDKSPENNNGGEVGSEASNLSSLIPTKTSHSEQSEETNNKTINE